MVAVKSQNADQFLRALPADIKAILIFGSDAGLVSERATDAAKRLIAKSTPPGEILRLDDTDLESDPDRLVIELTTIAMFGGRNVIRTTASRRVNTNMIGPLLESNTLEGALIIEAGNLKADEGLRPLFEKHIHAAAIPCYADSDRDLGSVIDGILKHHKLEISPDARRTLLTRLGADRALSRAEVEKLALYCNGKSRIEEADVEAATGDASELAIDMIVLAAGAGKIDAAISANDRAVSAGESPQTILIATQRHFQRLHRARATYEQNGSIDEALRALRPPLHFKSRDAFTAQVNAWSMQKLSKALEMIAKAQAQSRGGVLEDNLVTDRLVLDLGRLARWKPEPRGHN